MRRADLKVGGEYYFARSAHWLDGTHACKAVLVAEGAWRIDKTAYTFSKPHEDVGGGNGVLVDLHWLNYSDQIRVERTVVQGSQLRGTYEECLARVEELASQRRVRANQEQAAREVAISIRQQVVEVANSVGLKVRVATDPRIVEIDVVDLAAYLAGIGVEVPDAL